MNSITKSGLYCIGNGCTGLPPSSLGHYDWTSLYTAMQSTGETGSQILISRDNHAFIRRKYINTWSNWEMLINDQLVAAAEGKSWPGVSLSFNIVPSTTTLYNLKLYNIYYPDTLSYDIDFWVINNASYDIKSINHLKAFYAITYDSNTNLLKFDFEHGYYIYKCTNICGTAWYI